MRTSQWFWAATWASSKSNQVEPLEDNKETNVNIEEKPLETKEEENE